MNQLEALALSIVIEAAVAAAAARRLERAPTVLALTACGATLLTHPVLWVGALACYRVAPVPVCVLVLEVAVALAEAAAYAGAARLPWRRALALSAVANAASCGVGLMLSR